MVMPSDPNRDARDPGRDADELEQRAKSLFDESVERLDGHTRSKLTRARQAALDELKQHRARRWLAHPLGGLTAAALVAVVVMMWPAVVRTPTGPNAEPDDLELVANGEEIEMLQDVEFYSWLDEK